MPGTVIVGTQWGDEGKGRFTDLLCEDMSMVVRYQGGHNARHTIMMLPTIPRRSRNCWSVASGCSSTRRRSRSKAF